MRHSVYGRKLSRTNDERKRLFTVLTRDLFIHGAITTTVAKSKAVQPQVEKLITRAKTGGDANRRMVIAALGDRVLADQMLDEAKTRFAGRQSGFTRIIKLGKRHSDASEMAKFSFVDDRVVAEVVKPKAEKKAEGKTESKKIAAPVETKPKRTQEKTESKKKSK